MSGRSLFILLFLFASCAEEQQTMPDRYIDLKGYFRREAERLKKEHRSVHKTVSRNGVSESRQNMSPLWEREFSLFTESDINKPAWNKSYQVKEDSLSTTYTAIDPKLRTRRILIKKNGGRLTELIVVNSTKNKLYSSSEQLQYIPDSLYRITKKQDVILLGSNSYQISGFFTKPSNN